MTDALRFETVRVRTLRSTYWLAAAAVVLSGLVALGFSLDRRRDPIDWQDAALVLTGGGNAVPISLVGVFAALIGIFATGHEYRYDTILPTLTAMPRRTALLAAKVVVVAGVSALLAIGGVALSWVVAMLVRGEPVALDDSAPAALLGQVVLVVLYGVLGAALGQLTRAIPGAIVIILVTPLVIEPVIHALADLDALAFLRDVVPYLPFTAGGLLVSTEEVAATDGSLYELSRWEGGALLAAVTAVVLTVAWQLFTRRDA